MQSDSAATGRGGEVWSRTLTTPFNYDGPSVKEQIFFFYYLNLFFLGGGGGGGGERERIKLYFCLDHVKEQFFSLSKKGSSK